MKYLTLLILLGGCATSIDTTRLPPGDWPSLPIYRESVSAQRFEAVCGTAMTKVLACAQVNFPLNKCTIFVRDGETLSAEIERHERMHCAGYDHPGDSTMRDIWASWRK